jgi:RNA polymerase sigma-70 factor (ECF subfamily)
MTVTLFAEPPNVIAMDPLRRKTIHQAMVRLSDGDRSALPALLEHLFPVILAFAERGMRGHREDSEDVAQEVFLRICSRISDFDQERDGVSWAFGIASYAILSHRRRHQRRREVAGETELAAKSSPDASPEEAFIERELAIALQSAVGELSDDDRASLGLTLTPAVAGIQAATLRKRKQRALDRVRAIWRRIHGEP